MRRGVLLMTAVLLLSTADVNGWRRRRGGGCSAVNCQWSGWSCTACSASCGGGTQSCTRTVVVAASCGGAGCSGASSETRRCTGSSSCNHGSAATSGCSCNAGYTGSCCQSRVSCGALSSPAHGSISGSHYYGDRVTFSCSSGYYLQGSSSRTCQSNGRWSGTQPTCQRVACGALSSPAHGSISGSHYYGDRVTFSCSSGYYLQGSSSLTCGANGQWSGTQPTCQRKSCPSLTAPTDGAMQGTSFLFTDVVTFSCHTGYELSGSESRTCQADQVWSGSQPTCNRKLCQQLSSPDNGQVTGGHAYGDVASFSCSSGYELAGGDATRTCQDDQQWSGTQPTCARKACTTLDPPPNGAVYGGHLYGDTATFACDVGYELSGPSTITCQDIQTWTAASPTCDIKYCKAVSAPTNGQVSGGNLYGDTVTFTCDTGYELLGSATITCLANETWSHSPPVCQMVTCPELLPLANGQMSGGNLYGDIVTFVCNPGYELSGSDQRTCGANKQWSGSPAVCNRVSCPTLPTLLHGSISGETLYGDLLTFDCDQGYELYGNANVTCQADQTWSGTAPLCREILCPPLTPPLNGQMAGGNAYGDIVVYVCDAGYELVGGNVTRTCQEDKEWSGTQPECHKVSCSQLIAPTNGSVAGGTSFGDYAAFTCDAGYEIVGSNIMLCQANQQWSGTQPSCHRLQCATLPPLMDGHMTGGSLYGDTVTFSCHMGFHLVGSSERTCQADQQWSGTQPSCQRKECPPITAPDHGSVSGSHLFGSTLVISCDPGYELDGTGSRTCQADQTWSGVEPTCKAITCAALDPPLNGDVSGGNSFGDTVTFSCSVGFVLTGTANLTCQHDKQWSDSVPSCKRKECPLPSTPNNVQVTGGHLYEDVVTFSCLSGFTLNGNGTSVCQADQTWSGHPPSCDRVQCPALSSPTDGSFSGGFLYEDVVTFTCNEGYELSGTQTVTCQADMTWSSSEPTCERKPCPVLDGIVDGTVTGGHLYGDTDTFTCSSGYQLVGDQDRTCQADQTWSGVQPSCQKICCTSPLVANSLYVGDTCVNDTVTVTCDNGYTPVGNTTLTCTEDGVWDKEIPKCEAICCDGNLAIGNGHVQLVDGKFCYGSIAIFDCDTGYSLVGSGIASCLEDGTWSDMPSCERVCCGEVGQIHSGQITTNGTCYNDVATLTCDPGFQLISHSPIVCSADGKWAGNSFCESNPICIREDLASPANGHKICYTVTSVGEDRELCTMNCNPPKVYGLDVDTYECGDYTNWLWMTRQNNRLWFTDVSQCQDSEDPFMFIVMGGLTIMSTTVTPPQLAAIRRFIRDELLRQRLCTHPCRISHISVDEGIRSRALTRVRSTTDASPVYIIDVTIQLYVEHGSQLSLQSNLLPTDTDAFLRQVAVDVTNFLTSGAFVIPINGVNLTIEDTGVSISEPTVGCPVGFRPSGSYCVACPPGSMHVPMSGECAPCPIGTYQNSSAQADCQLCPGGTTTLSQGSSDISECKDYADCNCGPHPCMPTTYGWACQCPVGYVNNDDKCVVRGACPEGSKVLGDVCYMVSNTTATYRGAGDVCRLMGGQLVVVKNKETQDFIAANSDGKDLWIGLDDQLDEGQFKWSDGAALESFTYWAPGEPNDASTTSSQDCVHLWPLASFRWDDQPCDRMEYFVCQFSVMADPNTIGN
ncbi:PREDICTED: sushi, von Willebrand factor type A, EGF and pentraxin domain-containing protein 1-like [Branchiostoma belcheri]|uniref:Sushi, von Willebrand factor type A, EGF and pentraxin domain-containing protein 1-like n=1 Tax=Branchiostoma belcheri TaxID=7741 RepID=A0A6P4Y8K7_BRABE|nr:PREDICTED: sushi, von Willebrand factor type A, EGF and pentraxin domain-containing protein 1-like [Branchiostoma belcheri]